VGFVEIGQGAGIKPGLANEGRSTKPTQRWIFKLRKGVNGMTAATSKPMKWCGTGATDQWDKAPEVDPAFAQARLVFGISPAFKKIRRHTVEFDTKGTRDSFSV